MPWQAYRQNETIFHCECFSNWFFWWWWWWPRGGIQALICKRKYTRTQIYNIKRFLFIRTIFFLLICFLPFVLVSHSLTLFLDPFQERFFPPFIFSFLPFVLCNDLIPFSFRFIFSFSFLRSFLLVAKRMRSQFLLPETRYQRKKHNQNHGHTNTIIYSESVYGFMLFIMNIIGRISWNEMLFTFFRFAVVVRHDHNQFFWIGLQSFSSFFSSLCSCCLAHSFVCSFVSAFLPRKNQQSKIVSRCGIFHAYDIRTNIKKLHSFFFIFLCTVVRGENICFWKHNNEMEREKKLGSSGKKADWTPEREREKENGKKNREGDLHRPL